MSYLSIKAEIEEVVEHSNPSCGLTKECWTKCDKCGAERIRMIIVSWLSKHNLGLSIEFDDEWRKG